jgi:hypothetical protein
MKEKFDMQKAKEIREKHWKIDILDVPQEKRDDFRNAINCAVMLPAALDCIEALEGRIKKQGKIINALKQGNCPCEKEKTERIEELEKALIEERAAHIEMPCRHDAMMTACDFSGTDTGWCEGCIQKERIRQKARDQLTSEGLL